MNDATSTRLTPAPLILIGPSCAGKSTAARNLCRMFPERFEQAVTATTRSPRPRERDGIDYHFLSEEEFSSLRRTGGLVEETYARNAHYGLPRSAVDEISEQGRTPILVLDPSGAQAVRKMWPESFAVFLDERDDVIMERLERRGTAPEDIRARLADNEAIRDAVGRGEPPCNLTFTDPHSTAPKAVARKIADAYEGFEQKRAENAFNPKEREAYMSHTYHLIDMNMENNRGLVFEEETNRLYVVDGAADKYYDFADFLNPDDGTHPEFHAVPSIAEASFALYGTSPTHDWIAGVDAEWVRNQLDPGVELSDAELDEVAENINDNIWESVDLLDVIEDQLYAEVRTVLEARADKGLEPQESLESDIDRLGGETAARAGDDPGHDDRVSRIDEAR